MAKNTDNSKYKHPLITRVGNKYFWGSLNLTEPIRHIIKEAKIRAGRRFLEEIRELPNPYPEDIFPRLFLREDETKRLNDFMIKEFSTNLDVLSAELMRRARENVKEELAGKTIKILTECSMRK